MIKKVHVRCSTIQFDDSNLRTQLLQLPGPWSMESRPASRLKELDCSKVRAHTHALRQKLAQFNVRRRAGISSVRSPALFRKRARFKRAVLVALGSCMFGNLARWYENPRCHAPRALEPPRVKERTRVKSQFQDRSHPQSWFPFLEFRVPAIQKSACINVVGKGPHSSRGSCSRIHN